MSLDPLAVEFPAWSAYNYVLGNPVMLVDPNGKAPKGWSESNIRLANVFGTFGHGENDHHLFSSGQKESPAPVTIDVFIVNSYNIGEGDLKDIESNVLRILGRNGIPSNTFNINFLNNLSEAESLPGRIRYYDRILYQELSSKAGKLGMSDDNYPGLPGLRRSGTRISMDKISKHYKNSWVYITGLILAHEFAHQLDAFSLIQKQGNLDGRGFAGGHYNGINLLMPAQDFKYDLQPGQDHELLTDEVQSRILTYIY